MGDGCEPKYYCPNLAQYPTRRGIKECGFEVPGSFLSTTRHLPSWAFRLVRSFATLFTALDVAVFFDLWSTRLLHFHIPSFLLHPDNCFHRPS